LSVNHPLNGNAEAAVPGQRPFEEGGSVLLSQARQDFSVSQARGVVDRHVQVFVANPAGAMMAA
jgi:hypothetical protein